MKYLLSAIFVLALGITALLPGNDAGAANSSDFNASYIIDDYVFYNSSAMDANQIQNFLNSKNPNCDYNGTQSAADWGYPNITHAQLAEYKRNGTNGFSKDTGFHAPPYKCLTMYSQSTPQMEASSGYCSAISAGTRTAAQIINDIAKACGINPQVLIILLEKEQSLVTDKWPLNRQLRDATGFGCPDGAMCNPAYEGFFYQVYYAARQFKVYQAFPNNYNYRAGRNNTVYYHPGPYVNGAQQGIGYCGSSQLYIQNQATAALYIYTPYQPNQAALNNLYGSGDGCSSYGNRNFWRVFTDWFGSTKAPLSNVWIPNGTYKLINPRANKSLDISGAGTANGTNVGIWENNNSGAQDWQLTREESGFYTLRNPLSGKFLDVAGAGVSNGTNVHIWAANNLCAQRWSIIKSGNTYSLLSACSGLALDISGAGTANGTNVGIWSRNNSGAQDWQLQSLDSALITDGVYRLTTPSGKSLDISGAGTVNGTNVGIWENNNSGAQTWKVSRQLNGLYKLQNPRSGKYLDVSGAGTANGTNVAIWEANTSCAQEWAIVTNGDKTRLVSSCSGKSLDVSGNSTLNGANVNIWTNNNLDAQKWTFQTITGIVADGTYRLQGPGGKYLDVTGAGTSNGTNVWLWSSNNTGAQTWSLNHLGDDFYTLKNPRSGKYLDAAGGGTTNGTDVRIWSHNNTCALKWKIAANASGYYLLSACSQTKALDVAGGNSLDGTDIRIWDKNTTNAQRWVITAL